MDTKYKKAVVKTGREKSILKKHPWVYSGAIQEVEGHPEGGEIVDLVDRNGEFLARGAYSPQSKIRVRIWTWNPEQAIDHHFIHEVLETSIVNRKNLPTLSCTNACRLVNAESDRFPGLIVDQYDNILVMQCLSYGVEVWRDVIADSLITLTNSTGIYERSDADVRVLEGLQKRNEVIRGVVPNSEIIIEENSLKYLVDVKGGQKTGFFLDQRQNRHVIRELVKDKDVLDCFCYTGGFSISALAGGARSVVGVDASNDALAIAKKNVDLNHFDQKRVDWIQDDVFVFLRGMRDRNRKFDLIILDPPKFASSVSQVEKAARGYKDINLLAMKLLKPGGYLITFSCSGSVTQDLFRKIVAGAASDAGVDAQIIAQLHQAEDHPILLSFPEGEYLKGLIVKV